MKNGPTEASSIQALPYIILSEGPKSQPHKITKLQLPHKEIQKNACLLAPHDLSDQRRHSALRNCWLPFLCSGTITFLWAQFITQKPLAYWYFHQNVRSLGKNLQIPHAFPSRGQPFLTSRPSQKVLSLSLAFLWNERINFFFSCFSHCMIQEHFIGKCIELSSLSHVLFPVKKSDVSGI